MPDRLVGPDRPGRRVPARPEERHLPARRAEPRTLTRGRPDPRHPHARAAVAPTRVRRDPRRRAAHLRRARRRLQPGRAPPRGRGRRAARPGGVVGARPISPPSTSATASRKLGAALAPINPGFTEGEATTAIEYLRPRVVVVHPSYEEPARSIADRSASASSSRRPTWLDGASSAPLPRVGDSEDPSAIFLTSGSTGVAKAALLSHRATWLRAIAREAEDGSPGRQRRSGDVRPVPHGRLVLPRARVGGEPARAPRAPRRRRRAARRSRALAREHAVRHPRGVATHPRRRRRVRRVVAARSAHRHVARRPRPRRRVEGTLSGDLDIGRVRLHRDRPRRGADRRRPVRQAAERRVAATRGRGAHRRRRRAPATRPDDVLRVPRPPRRHRRRHRRRRLVPHRRPRHAATPTATSRSPGAAPRGSGRAASGSRRSRWKRPSSPTRPSPRSAWWGFPIPVGASWCARRSWRGRARRCRPSTSSARTSPRVSWRPKHPRVVVAVEQLPHTDATGQIRRAALRAEILAGGAHASG